MATINLGRVGFVQKGAYSGATAYKVNDVVVYNNGVYACISPTTGNLPTNTTYWKLWLDPSTLVAKTGDETIAGVKTFNSNTIFNGNVGIGTSSPAGRIDVSSADDTAMYFRNSSANIRLRPYVTSYSTSQISALNSAGNAYTPLSIGGSYTVIETNGTERMRIDTAGNVLVTSSGGGLGYGQGSGGTVTQLTSKSTSVTLNKPCGQIIMNNAALAAGASTSFVVNNSLATYIDNAIVTIVGGAGGYSNNRVQATCYGGGIAITVTNQTAGSLSEALVLTFTLIKGAIA